ncbi:hypothetical protein NDU88_002041 [Pleurodeles waltl]|uniref:Uncharacterized protein n=1 Tax=Pleurodeles waltl TaxID=8319 RepID=A0AAV7WNG6_PLEWA|nr:hypothetical protein NDU88_002041 [Pleurodeles waltl]
MIWAGFCFWVVGSGMRIEKTAAQQGSAKRDALSPLAARYDYGRPLWFWCPAVNKAQNKSRATRFLATMIKDVALLDPWCETRWWLRASSGRRLPHPSRLLFGIRASRLLTEADYAEGERRCTWGYFCCDFFVPCFLLLPGEPRRPYELLQLQRSQRRLPGGFFFSSSSQPQHGQQALMARRLRMAADKNSGRRTGDLLTPRFFPGEYIQERQCWQCWEASYFKSPGSPGG